MSSEQLKILVCSWFQPSLFLLPRLWVFYSWVAFLRLCMCLLCCHDVYEVLMHSLMNWKPNCTCTDRRELALSWSLSLKSPCTWLPFCYMHVNAITHHMCHESDKTKVFGEWFHIKTIQTGKSIASYKNSKWCQVILCQMSMGQYGQLLEQRLTQTAPGSLSDLNCGHLSFHMTRQYLTKWLIINNPFIVHIPVMKVKPFPTAQEWEWQVTQNTLGSSECLTSDPQWMEVWFVGDLGFNKNTQYAEKGSSRHPSIYPFSMTTSSALRVLGLLNPIPAVGEKLALHPGWEFTVGPHRKKNKLPFALLFTLTDNLELPLWKEGGM